MIRFIIFFLVVNYVYGQKPTQINIYEKKMDSVIYKIMNSNKKDSLKIALFNSLISKNRYAKHTILAINQAKIIAQNSKIPVLIADNYRSYGNYFFYNSQLDSAEFYLHKANNLLKNQDSPFLKTAIANALGGVYRKKGNITKAIQTLLQSKQILESLDTLSLTKKKQKHLNTEKLILHNTLANFYNQMEDYKSSIYYYNQAYTYANKIGAKKYAGVILSNKGDLILNNGDFKQALEVLIEAKKLKELGNAQKTSIANTNINIALAQLRLGNFNLALHEINDVIKFYEESNNITGLMEALSIRGEIFLKKRLYKKAISDCEKTQNLAISRNNLEIQEDACLCLSKANESLGNYKESLNYFKKYKTVKDSIFNEKNIKKITQLQMKHDYDKEIELREMKIALTKKENKATVRLLVFGIVSLVLISGLLFRLYYMRKKANDALREKNKMISETLAINKLLFKETHHRVKNNLQIISSLLNMQSKFLTDEKSKEIISDSQNRIKSMSLIHQKLYQEKNITAIETTEYFTELINSLSHSYGIDYKKVEMKISIENMFLDVDTAIPLGLILNELISNAFKHGVDKENGKFLLEFSRKEDYLWVKIKDDGKGIPENFDVKTSKSYGMKLIQTLSRKLKADIQFINDNGLTIILKITKFTLSK